MHSENEQLAAQAQSLRTEKTTLERRLEASTLALQGTRAESAEREKLATQLSAQITDLRAALATAEASAGTQRDANTKLKAQADQSTAELARLRLSLAGAEKNAAAAVADRDRATAQLAAMQERLTASDGQHDQIQLQLKAAQSDAAQVTAAQARVTELLSANQKLGAELKDLQSEAAALRAENARLTSAVEEQKKNAEPRPTSPTTAAAELAAPLRGVAPAAAAVPPPPSAPRVHIVQAGESLTRISQRYYGTPNRWREIYEANRDLLKTENTLRPGQQLRIP